MIVTSHKEGWQTSTQRSHGLLVAMLAYQYDIDLPNEVMVPTLIAIAEHDDGVEETKDKNNLTPAGAPRHLMVDDGSEGVDLTQKRSVMELSSSNSQLNALLTSLHIDFLFNPEDRKENKELDEFMSEQDESRKKLLKDLDISKKDADKIYRFLEWCDAFSLLICMDKIQPKGRKMEISESPEGKMSEVFYKSTGEMTVEPWLFKQKSLKVFYEYKVLNQLKFKSTEELDEASRKAEVHRKEFTLME
ncbi:MAG: hypothetical protein ACI9V1_002801 [Spirosomataceae bacterium]|jgi:hypothetical protein